MGVIKGTKILYSATYSVLQLIANFEELYRSVPGGYRIKAATCVAKSLLCVIPVAYNEIKIGINNSGLTSKAIYK